MVPVSAPGHVPACSSHIHSISVPSCWNRGAEKEVMGNLVGQSVVSLSQETAVKPKLNCIQLLHMGVAMNCLHRAEASKVEVVFIRF